MNFRKQDDFPTALCFLPLSVALFRMYRVQEFTNPYPGGVAPQVSVYGIAPLVKRRYEALSDNTARAFMMVLEASAAKEWTVNSIWVGVLLG
jgi:hypothetical protein